MIGILDRLEHVAVDLDVTAGDRQIDRLALGTRQVADHLREGLRQRREGQHDERLDVVEQVLDERSQRALIVLARHRQTRRCASASSLTNGVLQSTYSSSLSPPRRRASSVLALGRRVTQPDVGAGALAFLVDRGAHRLPPLLPDVELGQQVVQLGGALAQDQLDR